MSFTNDPSTAFTDAINKGFSKQADDYDRVDRNNPLLKDMRHQVYAHVENFLKPGSHVLELNAGTGLDALYLVARGNRVHATDLSDGMVSKIRSKIREQPLPDRLTCQQLSYTDLDKVEGSNFDYVFSNFGGLNCIKDLSLVTRHLPGLIKPGAYVTWVIMPPVCLWEMLWIFKGKWKLAFRRLKKNGTLANVEGEFFTTYYHSLKTIRNALGPSFKLVRSEGLAALTPQPHYKGFMLKNRTVYNLLRKADACVKDNFPFNRWADHIIVTFQYRG